MGVYPKVARVPQQWLETCFQEGKNFAPKEECRQVQKAKGRCL